MHNTVLLDLDGTLTDPYPGIAHCIAHALGRLGIPVPDHGEIPGWIGPPLLRSFQVHLGRHGGGDAHEALRHYRECYGDCGWSDNRVYPGIEDALHELRECGASLILATAKPTIYATRIVEHFGLSPMLDAVHGSELDGRNTDKRDLVAAICSVHGLHPAACAMIGDRGEDMVAARHHGVTAIGVLWGYGTAEELDAAGAAVLLESPREMAPGAVLRPGGTAHAGH